MHLESVAPNGAGAGLALSWLTVLSEGVAGLPPAFGGVMHAGLRGSAVTVSVVQAYDTEHAVGGLGAGAGVTFTVDAWTLVGGVHAYSALPPPPLTVLAVSRPPPPAPPHLHCRHA